MPVIVPPRTEFADLAGDYLRGVQTGQSIAAARQRIDAENARTQMEAQARQQTLQEETLRRNAQLQTEAAYRKTQLALEQQRLDAAAQINAAKTHEAAMVLADKQGFAADLAGGMPVEQALYRHPRISSPAAVESARRDALNLGDQRIKLAQQRAEQEAQRIKIAQDKAAAVPEIKGTVIQRDDQGREIGSIRGNLSQVQTQAGTNAPPMMRPPVEKVRVKDPKGKTGLVPAENLQKFLDNGYTRVQ